jgi:hypothetical protein
MAQNLGARHGHKGQGSGLRVRDTASLPSAFSGLFFATGSYFAAFALFGLPAAAAGLWLLMQR